MTLKMFKGRKTQIKQTNFPNSTVDGYWLGMAVFGQKLATELVNTDMISISTV